MLPTLDIPVVEFKNILLKLVGQPREFWLNKPISYKEGEIGTLLLLEFTLDELSYTYYPIKVIPPTPKLRLLTKQFHSLGEYLSDLQGEDADPALFTICPAAWHFLLAFSLFERGFH